MNALIWVFGMGLLDRVRGSGWCAHCHLYGMLGMGLVAAALLGAHGWIAAYIVAAVMLGAAPGWGNPIGAALDGRPMGAAYEWWQVGFMRRSIPAALLFRGAMWGAPLLPKSPAAAAAFAIGFTAAPYLTRLLDPPSPRIDRWAFMEYTRGAAIAALLLLFSSLK